MFLIKEVELRQAVSCLGLPQQDRLMLDNKEVSVLAEAVAGVDVFVAVAVVAGEQPPTPKKLARLPLKTRRNRNMSSEP